MAGKTLLDVVLALPAAERVELYQRLRESLRNDPALEPTPIEDQRALDARLDDLAANPDAASPWEEVEARIEQMLKARP